MEDNMELELTPSEGKLLITVLERHISDLSMEIADTESLNFRNEIKNEKHILEEILLKLNKT
jgi:antitoxin component of MazEF toxin-antitoxin module